jgi:peptidoglycan/LPS O-acetylase OafA/YrhL
MGLGWAGATPAMQCAGSQADRDACEMLGVCRYPPPMSAKPAFGWGPSFGAVMAAGRTSGFDYLRLLLAAAVLCSHGIDVSYGINATLDFENGPIRPFIAIILPMFFALSGFLVAGSLERRRTLVSFLGLRVIRLVPALAFETVLAALVLGPLLTRLPLADYLRDPLLPRYFLNIVGDIQYLLPGTFEGNPWARTVNAQLWTLPFELMCYVSLAGLAVFGAHRRRRLFALVVVGLNVVLLAGYVINAGAAGWNTLPVAPGPSLVLAFLYGVTFYLYRDAIPHSPLLGLASGALALVLLVHPATDYLVPPLAAYFTAWLGLMRPRPSLLTRSGDYSYGIFLFGFPIQQAVTQVLGPDFHAWGWNIAVSLPLTLLLAILSWHAIEKPALRLRGPLKRLEDRIVDRSNGRAGQTRPSQAEPGSPRRELR